MLLLSILNDLGWLLMMSMLMASSYHADQRSPGSIFGHLLQQLLTLLVLALADRSLPALLGTTTSAKRATRVTCMTGSWEIVYGTARTAELQAPAARKMVSRFSPRHCQVQQLTQSLFEFVRTNMCPTKTLPSRKWSCLFAEKCHRLSFPWCKPLCQI